jgi:hypothetical protein
MTKRYDAWISLTVFVFVFVALLVGVVVCRARRSQCPACGTEQQVLPA